MKLGPLFGWGIVIYAILSLTTSGIVIYNLSSDFIPHLIQGVVLVIVCLIAGNSLRFRAWHDILPYSILWAIIFALLDAFFVVPLEGWNIYRDWSIWAGYVLVALIPLLAPWTHKEMIVHGPWET